MKEENNKKQENEKENEKHHRTKKQKSKTNSYVWTLQAFVLTFFLALSFSVVSQLLIGGSTPIFVAIILLAIIIAINIFFDILGVATAACELEPFLSMSSRKIRGAKMAVKIIKNAEKFCNVCSDVVGDICGIISGSLGASIIAVVIASSNNPTEVFLPSVLFSSMIAAVTVGGKSFGKKIALDNRHEIVFFMAKVFSLFTKK